ncbi:hypothetical protein FTX61_11285 [Nitriliruptoraceae bacterium ZYF776]|nr:hypothetical protein [Profundirhabdus halotolerans]
MQLRPPPDPTTVPTDVATGLRRAVDQLGFRPAVSVLRPDRRDEQGVATLAQWAAKGAHLLEAELLLTPGDRVHVDLAPSWPLAAVCLAVWWTGATVTLDGDAEVAIVEEGRTPPAGAVDVLRVGAAVDGAPLDPATDGEPYPQAVQAWPDHPPAPRAAPELTALTAGPRRFDQRELLAEAASLGDRAGALGVDASTLDPLTAVLAVAARPVALGRATVVLAGVDRDAAGGDAVRHWLP